MNFFDRVNKRTCTEAIAVKMCLQRKYDGVSLQFRELSSAASRKSDSGLGHRWGSHRDSDCQPSKLPFDAPPPLLEG